MALPTVSVPATLTVREGSKLTIPLTKKGAGACQIQVVTGGNTATSPADYIGYEPPWTVKFASAQTSAQTSLTTVSDKLTEKPETVTIWLVNPVNCTVTQGKCVVTIQDVAPPVPPAPPSVSIPPTLKVVEGKTLTIPLAKSGTGACSVKLKTTGNTAKTVLDYAGYEPQQTISFGATQTSATTTLRTLPDALVEGPETVAVSILDPVGCVVSQGTCIVTIEDATSKPEAPSPEPVVEPPLEPEPPESTEPVPEPEIPPIVEPPVVEPPPVVPAPVMPSPLTPKYPRPVGFATASPAGVGRSIYRVTNLNNSGPGSLRDGVSQGNRVVVFEVSGCIRLGWHLVIEADNITIAGQTAPGAGITIQGKELQVKASNIRVQHLTFERGYDASNLGNADVVKVSPGADNSVWRRSNIHFDHCCFLWGLDETVEIWPAGGSLSNVSFTECYIGEPLWRPQKLGFAAHEKVSSGQQGEHNYGMLIGFGAKRVDVQNCVFADIYMRTPFIDHGTSVVLANNILMNVRMGMTIQQNSSPPPRDPCLVNAQGILSISGPQSVSHTGFRFHAYPDKWPAGSAVYVNGQYGWKGANGAITPGTSVTFSKAQPTQGALGTKVMVDTPPIQPPGTTVKALTADAIFSRAVANCGPMPKAAKRNPAVARCIEKLRTKRSGWVDHESQVGGFSSYPRVYRNLEDAVMPDGTKIPVPVATDAAAVQQWLDVFSSLVSHD